MKFGPQSNIVQIHFELVEVAGVHGMPDLAVAGLERPAPAGAVPTWSREEWLRWARWQATIGEHLINFQDRIRAELKAEWYVDTLPAGALVFIYHRGGFWQRSQVRRLIPAVPAPAFAPGGPIAA
jgi:hypothetical protein